MEGETTHEEIEARIDFSTCVSIFCSIDTHDARTGDYLGEVCWNFTNTTSETTGIIRLGVEHIGDNHYLCSGKVAVTSPIILNVPVFGNAEIVDGKIVIFLTVPGRRNGNLGSEIAYFSLNPSNYNGTFENFGFFSDKMEISEGTITLTTCS